METIERDNVIVNTTRIVVGPEHRKELFQTFQTLLGPIRREKGCLAYRFYLEAGNENSTVLIGEWETQEDWDNHLRSDDFAVLLGAIKVLSNTSNIDFKILSFKAGLETVMMARTTSEE
jgi:quinol monooxygenase YgiN